MCPENDGWQVGGSVFDSAETGYISMAGLPFKHQPSFASVAINDTKDNSCKLSKRFSDYQNAAYFEGKTVESLLVKRYTISSADIGKTLTFSFDAKRPVW